MNAFFSTVHPTEDYDIVVVYDEDSLRIEYVWDDNKEEVVLNQECRNSIKQEVEENYL